MIHEDFFCPNPCCKMHNNPGEGKWYYRNGKYFTKVRGGVIVSLSPKRFVALSHISTNQGLS